MLDLKHTRSVKEHGLFMGTIRFSDFSQLLENMRSVYFFQSRISGQVLPDRTVYFII